jgi:MerR family transcriptional regulator, mercuric resistance operon regulatory protein
MSVRAAQQKTPRRRFPPATVDRLRFIQGCQRLGLRLRELGDLLSVRDTGVCPCEPAETLLRRRLAEVDAELARLNALRADLGRMLDGLPVQPCPAAADPFPSPARRPPGQGTRTAAPFTRPSARSSSARSAVSSG